MRTPASEPPAPVLRKPARLRDPSEMVRRAPPPERSADLSALREIANMNARAAIDTHARRTLVHAWLSKAVVMLMAIAAFTVEIWFGVEGTPGCFYLAVPCLVVAVLWGWQYISMSKTLNKDAGDAKPVADDGSSRDEPTDETPLGNDE